MGGLGRERVAEIQRARIIVAMAEVACERGVADASVAHVVERAGVSRRTFYELFDDREDCFLAALEEAIARASHQMSIAYDRALPWVKRIRAGLEALLDFLGQESVFARVAVVESVAAGPRALELRRQTIERIVAAVDDGRASVNGSSSATPLTAEGVVGGAIAVIHARLVSGDEGSLSDLANPLMSMIVLPYLGPIAARRELQQLVAKARPPVSLASANPLKHLDMRLTYRTVRALVAVAAKPGSSNRMVGNEAGIGDQGQVSKLLARLEKLGLIENMRIGAPRGATNTWRLTERGEEVADVLTTGATTF